MQKYNHIPLVGWFSRSFQSSKSAGERIVSAGELNTSRILISSGIPCKMTSENIGYNRSYYLQGISRFAT